MDKACKVLFLPQVERDTFLLYFDPINFQDSIASSGEVNKPSNTFTEQFKSSEAQKNEYLSMVYNTTLLS